MGYYFRPKLSACPHGASLINQLNENLATFSEVNSQVVVGISITFSRSNVQSSSVQNCLN